MLPHRVAIVAAVEREVHPLIKNWTQAEHGHEGRRFKFFEHENRVLVCGGIGENAARRATEAVIALYSPMHLMSVGFAGALDTALQIGDIVVPDKVVDARDGSSVETDGSGKGVLLTFSSIAGVSQKTKLAKAFGGQAVDMEAASVARVAQSRGVLFSAVKVISDGASFEIPAMDKFVVPGGAREGTFLTGRFVAFALLRPWLWPNLARLAMNSSKASGALCHWLEQHEPELDTYEEPLHPITVDKELK
ncbi:MAG: hypothetical protein NVS1B11_07000 [Terriglobales bacterium]